MPGNVPQIDFFFRECMAALRRIVAAAKGDVSLDDVKNEAWLIANDPKESPEPLDLTSPTHQDSLLNILYRKFVGRLRTSVGRAARLDDGWDSAEDDGKPRLRDTLRAHDLADPLCLLEHQEQIDPLEQARLRSYSQATAYVICLTKWPSTLALSIYLCIKLSTLDARVRNCRAWITYQPSLFDGVEYISRDFMPARGKQLLEQQTTHYDDRQLAWTF